MQLVESVRCPELFGGRGMAISVFVVVNPGPIAGGFCCGLVQEYIAVPEPGLLVGLLEGRIGSELFAADVDHILPVDLLNFAVLVGPDCHCIASACLVFTARRYNTSIINRQSQWIILVLFGGFSDFLGNKKPASGLAGRALV